MSKLSISSLSLCDSSSIEDGAERTGSRAEGAATGCVGCVRDSGEDSTAFVTLGADEGRLSIGISGCSGAMT